MKHEARTLFNTTQALFTTHYQRRSYQTLIAGFLNATGNPRPERAMDKSAAALSRFLNQYAWNARHVIRIVRTAIQKRVWDMYAACRGRKPTLEIMLDLTTLEKTGVFPNLEIHALKDKIGLHLIVLYIVIGLQRFPWSFLIWRGKGSSSPTQLGLELLKCIPASWGQCFNVRVLADSGFDSTAFIDGVNQLGIHGVIGARGNRDIGDGQHLYNLRYQGTRVQFKSCDTRVYAAWFQLRQARGEMVWRYVISTRAAEGKTITRWGKRRWRIEATLPVRCMVRVKKRSSRR